MQYGFYTTQTLYHYHKESNKGFMQMTVPENEIHYLEIVTPDAEASLPVMRKTLSEVGLRAVRDERTEGEGVRFALVVFEAGAV